MESDAPLAYLAFHGPEDDYAVDLQGATGCSGGASGVVVPQGAGLVVPPLDEAERDLLSGRQ